MPGWTADQIPDQTGRIIAITGATSGLGLACAQALAARGAELVLAVRNTANGETVAGGIRARHPGAKITVSALDLASLASVAEFARRADGSLPRLDVLMNNAGLGMQPARHVTKDGFEQQFGTNHLGHFALTAQLIPALLRAPAPRVVPVASIAHRGGKIAWDDLETERPYDGRASYNQSKLANLMFGLELAAQATEQGSRLASITAHPGFSTTGFIKATDMSAARQAVFNVAAMVLGQSAEAGAAPQLYAATMPDAKNGDYWGPDGFMEIRGKPARGKVSPQAMVRADCQRLWRLSEELTGVAFPGLAG
jgi:NAD(P)-dependent dehydrogenase (short-subunit alcohol dehydrogenase family)